jgi:cold-inducible RNA-binding protein
MAKRLFIGGLPFSSTEDELKTLFAQAGTVTSATIIIDKFSGRSKGFGFVEMSSDEEATKAIETLNNTEMGGRKLIVAEAKPMEERRPDGDDRRGGGRGGYGGGRDRGGYGGRGGGGGYSRGGGRW